jgi:hypothetical protein
MNKTSSLTSCRKRRQTRLRRKCPWKLIRLKIKWSTWKKFNRCEFSRDSIQFDGYDVLTSSGKCSKVVDVDSILFDGIQLKANHKQNMNDLFRFLVLDSSKI